MRKNLVGRLVVTLVTAAAAVGGTVALAQPASAATADSCLKQLSAKTGWGYDTTMTTKGSLTFYTHEYFGSLCNGMRVSMGISRTNTFGFRNLNASKYAVTSGSNAFRNTHQLGLDDYGSWMIRQIAVKDKAGKLVVKTFTKETTPRILTSRYASVLTGTPKGKLVPKAGKVNVKGTLKSWHYYGRLVNVQNQQVVVQVRQPHKVAYTTRATATTSRTGAFSTNLNTAGLKGYDVRVAFVSKIPMTASSYTFLGTIS